MYYIVKKSIYISVPSLIVLALAASVISYFEVSAGIITRDLAATANLHPFTGALSNLGILLWCSSGILCFFLHSR